eukprot:scaffold4189_cov378-Prasinococcus_capsulatus_cf.AAC.11
MLPARLAAQSSMCATLSAYVSATASSSTASAPCGSMALQLRKHGGAGEQTIGTSCQDSPPHYLRIYYPSLRLA